MADRRRTRASRCVERVTVPSPEVAYYNYPETGNINSAGLIPLNEVLLLSENISTVDNSSIRLLNGVYKVSFSSVGVPSSEQRVGAGIYLNNNSTNIISLASSNENKRYPLSGVGVVVSSSDNTLLSLRNFGNAPASYLFTNLVVEKLT
ncbi:MAG: hypothetical protein ACOCWI_01065 [Bacillota bacterium]